MRSNVLFLIPVFAMLNSGCGAPDPSAPPPAAGGFIASPLSLALGADGLGVGSSSTGTITLSTPAPADGAVVALWSSDGSSLAMPVTITIPAGAYAATFTLTNSYGGHRKSVTVMANYEDAWAQGSLYVPSLPPEPPPCRGHACQM
jgi:hypothetical protein